MTSLRQKLATGMPVFGTWIASADPLSAELMGKIGYDCVVLDTQHGGIAESQLLPLFQTFDLTGTPALVRVNWLDPAKIMRAADLGAAGVVVPMVSTAEDARRAVAAIRYPPQGIRSFGPVRTYYTAGGSKEDPLLLVMVETAEAMDNLDAIAATPGLDGILIGPVDLALSMGLGIRLEMPDEILAAIETIAAACRKLGIVCASVALGLANARAQFDLGVQLMTSGSDTLFMRRAAALELEELRRLPS
jgi:4-hydroxy-2-oxoheptanedioate aldolase